MADVETQELVRAREEQRRAVDELDRAVVAARAAGMSWEEIGRVLEVEVADVPRRPFTPGSREGSAAPTTLTDEEQVIVDLVLDGRTNQSIADRLFLSKRSLEVRLTRIYQALGVAGKADLRRARRASRSTMHSTELEPPISAPGVGVTSSTDPETGGPDTLGPEEDTILRLVLDGRTNADIAAQLFLSKRSVELRLTTIYRALGVSRKSQLLDPETGAPRRPAALDRLVS